MPHSQEPRLLFTACLQSFANHRFQGADTQRKNLARNSGIDLVSIFFFKKYLSLRIPDFKREVVRWSGGENKTFPRNIGRHRFSRVRVPAHLSGTPIFGLEKVKAGAPPCLLCKHRRHELICPSFLPSNHCIMAAVWLEEAASYWAKFQMVPELRSGVSSSAMVWARSVELRQIFSREK